VSVTESRERSRELDRRDARAVRRESGNGEIKYRVRDRKRRDRVRTISCS
jgi:hypothetical protein